MSTIQYAAGDGDGKNCSICGMALTAEQLGQAICGSKQCHDRMIEESGKAILARKREKHDRVAAETFLAAGTEVAAAKDTLSAAAVTWMLPGQNEPLEPLPDDRLARFREHLDVCAEFAFREPAPAPEADLTQREKYETGEDALVTAACSTCQGRCCRDRGGDTALLLPTDLARYRQRNPGVTREQVIEAYLSHLPATSTRDGCVYQAVTGCSLPREMRQDICNSYYCDPLRWLRAEITATSGSEAVLVAAHKGAPQRVATISADGSRKITADMAGTAE